MKKYAGEEFLNKLYKDLVHSDEVKHTAKGANKNEDLAIYLNRIERITEVAKAKNKLDLLKKFYYDRYIIKEYDVPESHFEMLKKIALERGYGHIDYDEYTKNQEINSIISEQKGSLDRWLNYFISEETNCYPMWFKYYVFQNVMKIGYFDKSKNQFTKRTQETTKPFIEINREAIAMLYDELCKHLDKQKITDEQLEQLIKNGSFNKIYSYITKKLDEEKKINIIDNEGIWKKYEQGSNPEILFNDIHGMGTGWCTAGGLETATAHLEGGDFHVYYTKGENGEYTNPRIAIRMEYNNIAEIRGIAENQNLESEMEIVVEEKLKEFPDKNEYLKKVSDMKELTKLYKKMKNKELISEEEKRFLYEEDSEIIGFGYDKDPRIEEIIEYVELVQKIAELYNIEIKDISFDSEEALKGNIKLHYGDLTLSDLQDGKGVILPENVDGMLNLFHFINVDGMVFPKAVNGSIHLEKLPKAKGLIFPKKVNGAIFLKSLTAAQNIVFPNIMKGEIFLDNLTVAKNIIFPHHLFSRLEMNKLVNAQNLIFPPKVDYSIEINNLASAKGLVLPKVIDGSLILNGLTSAEGFVFPKHISGSLVLNNLRNVKSLKLPKNENGEFYVPCDNLICPFTKEQLIKAAKKAEAKQLGTKLFENNEEVTKITKGNNDGIWKKYSEESNPEDLFNDLHGKSIDSNLANNLKSYLKDEDLYIYYCKDGNEEYTKPLLLIRIKDGEVVEIKKIVEKYSLENKIENAFLTREEYSKKITNMKELIKIFKKYKLGEALTKRELEYLYSITSTIVEKDYDKSQLNIEMLIEQFVKNDLSKIFGVEKNEISVTEEEALKGNINIHYGALDLSDFTSAKNLFLPKKVVGSVYLANLIDAHGLILPEYIEGSLVLSGLNKAEGLILPRCIEGSLSLRNLKSIEGIMLPKNEKGEFYVPANKLNCDFTCEQLIEAAKRTETNQREPKIFEEVDELSDSGSLKV